METRFSMRIHLAALLFLFPTEPCPSISNDIERKETARREENTRKNASFAFLHPSLLTLHDALSFLRRNKEHREDATRVVLPRIQPSEHLRSTRSSASGKTRDVRMPRNKLYIRPFARFKFQTRERHVSWFGCTVRNPMPAFGSYRSDTKRRRGSGCFVNFSLFSTFLDRNKTSI